MSNASLETLLAGLSSAEKLAALDLLWRDLSANPAAVPSPDWHVDVLATRLAEPVADPRLELDAALADVKDRLNARRTQN